MTSLFWIVILKFVWETADRQYDPLCAKSCSSIIWQSKPAVDSLFFMLFFWNWNPVNNFLKKTTINFIQMKQPSSFNFKLNKSSLT